MTEQNWKWGQSQPNRRSQKFRMKLIRKKGEMGSRDCWRENMSTIEGKGKESFEGLL